MYKPDYINKFINEIAPALNKPIQQADVDEAWLEFIRELFVEGHIISLRNMRRWTHDGSGLTPEYLNSRLTETHRHKHDRERKKAAYWRKGGKWK